MKSELIGKLERNRDELFKALEDLSETQITTLRVLDAWTIKDLVGHLAFWERVIHTHVRESYTEGRPRLVKTDESDDDVNARQASKRHVWNWARVRAEFENARGALIERVKGLSESELSFQVPSPWRGEQRFYSVAQMIEEDAIDHCREHIEQIEQWKRHPTASEQSHAKP